MLRFNYMIKCNYNMKILGKDTFLIFKANFHGYNSIYCFNVDLQ
jgi:hypothetical protein